MRLAVALPVGIFPAPSRLNELCMRVHVSLGLLALVALPVSLRAQQARPWQATDYYKLTFLADPQMSPDGRRVAFAVTTVVEDKDKRHSEIWMVAADGSAPSAVRRAKKN